jgi:hypothetical protein
MVECTAATVDESLLDSMVTLWVTLPLVNAVVDVEFPLILAARDLAVIALSPEEILK